MSRPLLGLGGVVVVLVALGCGLGGDTDTDDAVVDPDAGTGGEPEVPADTDTPVAFEGATDEECWDDVDQDGDGLVDCDDPGCGGQGTCDSARYQPWRFLTEASDLDLTRDAPGSCPALPDPGWTCMRVTTNALYEQCVEIIGARVLPDGEVRFTCRDADGRATLVRDRPGEIGFRTRSAQRALGAPWIDPEAPDTLAACGAAPEDHPLAAGLATWTPGAAGDWTATPRSATFQAAFPPDVRDCHLDRDAEASIAYAAQRDAPDRGVVFAQRGSGVLPLFPSLEHQGRARVFLEPTDDAVWFGVSTDGQCLVPCVFRWPDTGLDGAPVPVTLHRPQLVPVGDADQKEGGAFWVDGSGVPTMSWSYRAGYEVHYRGVARYEDGVWVGGDVRCPVTEAEGWPRLTEVVDHGEVWVTGGRGGPFQVDPETMRAVRLASGPATDIADFVLERADGSLWAASRTRDADGRNVFWSCAPR